MADSHPEISLNPPGVRDQARVSADERAFADLDAEDESAESTGTGAEPSWLDHEHDQVTATVSLRPQETRDTVVLRKSGELPQEVAPKPPTVRQPGAEGDGKARAPSPDVFDSVEALSRDELRSSSHLVQREHGLYALASPDETMWQNELARYRHMISVVLGIVVMAALTLPFMGGSPVMKLILYGCMGVLTVTCVWQRATLEHPERVRRGNVRVTWLAAALTTCAAVAFFGLYSPAPIIMALEVLLVGMTNDRLLGYAFYGITAGFAAVMGVALGLDAFADPGLIHAGYLDQQNRLVGLVLVEAVLASALWIGVSTRREIMASFDKLHKASRLVAQQQAMVREVRQDLKRAANVGGRGPLTGEVLGSFELGVVIGRGGMGEVYRAVHVDTGELAAVKVLQASAMDEPGAGMRFAREVAVARSLEVPNIVRVLEVGGGNAVPYLAMEYLRGQDLARYLRRRGRMSRAKVEKLLREAGAGIHAAGQAGIVHRDIKPHNLFLAELSDKEKVWKILDFGVATLAGHSGTLTQGRVIGTPAYMAPEQARGKSVDHRADLYALASIAYRALTGHPPYSGDDLPSLLYRVVHEMPRRPTRLAELSEDIDAALAVGMAKDPDERFQSADELVEVISAALAGTLDERFPDMAARARALTEKHPWR